MRSLVILIAFFTLLSCSSEDINSSNIVGTWKLTQVLADPGDGSGVFSDIDSDKTITFFSDDTFLSNGNLCFFDSITPEATEGAFSIEYENITPYNCETFHLIDLNYKIENGTLIVYFHCIEACAEKYTKIK